MNDNPTVADPAENYYPEFIYSLPGDPQPSFPLQLPLVTSANGVISSSTKVFTPIQQINKAPINRQQTPARLADNVATNQGFSDNEMIETTRTDPKKNLLRNPAQTNLPRLIVDDSVIRQTLQTPRTNPINLDYHYEQIARYHQMNYAQRNGDLMNMGQPYESSNLQPVRYVDDEQPVDNDWKKEIRVDDKGVVTIEPIVYKEPSYQGPFGLSRSSTFMFYVCLGILTVFAGIFLIMSGILYATSSTSGPSRSGDLAGIAICALAFYVGLQTILIGLWHQKHRQENPVRIIQNSTKHASSSTYVKPTKSTIQDHYMYGYSYPQQMNYTPAVNYPVTPYVPNVSEQMLLQGTPPGTGFYPPIIWPYNGVAGAEPDPKLFPPIGWAYGQPPMNGTTLTSEPITTNNNKTIPERPLPSLNKAPETKEIIQQNASMVDKESASSNGHRHRHSDGHHHNHHSHRNHDHHHNHSRHHRRDRHRSHSPCSICSYNAYYSEVSNDPHQHHRHVEPIPKVITPQSSRARTVSPTKFNTKIYRDNGVGTERERKPTKDSSVTADLEDVSNNHDTSFQEVPIVHRTVIVEPYPAEPSSHIVVTPRLERMGSFHLDNYQYIHNDNDRMHKPSTTVTKNKKSKKKKNTTESKDNIIEDLNLEDVNGDAFSITEPSTNRRYKVFKKTPVENAFYN